MRGEKPSVIFDNQKDTFSKLLSICLHQKSLKPLIINSLLLYGITVISHIALNLTLLMLQVKIKFRFKLFNLALIIHKLGLGDKEIENQPSC